VHSRQHRAHGSHLSPRLGRSDDGSVMHKIGYAVIVVLLATGVAAQQDWIPDLNQDRDIGAIDHGTEPPPSGPGLDLPQPAAAPAVLDPASPGPNVRPAVVRQLLAEAVKSKALGHHLALDVQPLGVDRDLVSLGGDAPVTPASTLKLLTCVAALRLMGPEHRFATDVVSGRTRRSIVLVGGGDPLLTGPEPSQSAQTAYPQRASIQELARRTATTLLQKGVRRVRVTYDDSLYSGPSVNPAWEPSYVSEDVVSPIVPLWVDEGRAVDGYARRVADPAATAAARFSAYLARAGVKTRGATAARTRAPVHADVLASVRSAPLAQIVQHVLETSDNEGAETLLRQSAMAAGRPGSFADGVATVKRQLTALGVDVDAVTMHDGSGLSRRDDLPVHVLADVLQLAASEDHPELRAVVSSLPVAGFTGSLLYRFVEDAPEGLGLVRAKTGTLTGVHALAGIVMTRRGTPLVFAAVADEVPLRKTLDARAQLDRIAARLSTCPC
jgi:serine-type D-Ala-D-Ala carboxypeptidase/endopeptidase (penicillin-binding protein 4)